MACAPPSARTSTPRAQASMSSRTAWRMFRRIAFVLRTTGINTRRSDERCCRPGRTCSMVSSCLLDQLPRGRATECHALHSAATASAEVCRSSALTFGIRSPTQRPAPGGPALALRHLRRTAARATKGMLASGARRFTALTTRTFAPARWTRAPPTPSGPPRRSACASALAIMETDTETASRASTVSRRHRRGFSTASVA